MPPGVPGVAPSLVSSAQSILCPRKRQAILNSAALQVSNTDAPDGFSEALIASITGVMTGLSIASTGPAADIAAGSGDTSSLAVGFSTATAGTITGTATLGLASDGGTGAGSIDGLGQVAENSVTAPISVQVNNHAVAELTSSNGARTPGSDPNTRLTGCITTSRRTANTRSSARRWPAIRSTSR